MDANVILSAHAFGSNRMQSLLEAITSEHKLIVPEQVLFECIAVTKRKNPEKLEPLERFIAQTSVHVIPMGQIAPRTVEQMRDETDQPILETALAANVDIIISGDKDFHALEIDRPRIMRPADFIAEYLDL